MRLAILLALAVVGTAAPALGQVIEIADDGTARTFDRPTRFVSEADAVPVAVVKPVARDDIFARAAAMHKVDVNLLRAVAWTESRGRVDAVSNRGAIGVMQLMPATAAELGVDPRDAASNIAGGAAYLARQINRFGSVPLALAAYNAGPGAVLRYGGIPPYAETQGYVAQVLRRWNPAPLSPMWARVAPVVAPVIKTVVALPQVALGDGLLIEVTPL